jgi:hypothetical protein
MSEKIKPHHLSRKAILYVRKSSSYQVVYNMLLFLAKYLIVSRRSIKCRGTPACLSDR